MERASSVAARPPNGVPCACKPELGHSSSKATDPQDPAFPWNPPLPTPPHTSVSRTEPLRPPRRGDSRRRERDNHFDGQNFTHRRKIRASVAIVWHRKFGPDRLAVRVLVCPNRARGRSRPGVHGVPGRGRRRRRKRPDQYDNLRRRPRCLAVQDRVGDEFTYYEGYVGYDVGCAMVGQEATDCAARLNGAPLRSGDLHSEARHGPRFLRRIPGAQTDRPTISRRKGTVPGRR